MTGQFQQMKKENAIEKKKLIDKQMESEQVTSTLPDNDQ